MPEKILIVEDNEINRKLLRDILRYHGYDVIEAVNGAEAVEMARAHKVDLILMDIQMPVMNGYEAIKTLRNNPLTKEIRIIAVTSFVMKGDKEKALEAGADEYLCKPIDTRELPVIVKRILEAERR